MDKCSKCELDFGEFKCLECYGDFDIGSSCMECKEGYYEGGSSPVLRQCLSCEKDFHCVNCS